MSQIFQDVRKKLEEKPSWMGERVWEELTKYWGSYKFKKASTTNTRNRKSMDGASLHTGGSIPHRVHWKRMKKEKGEDPSLSEFYFRTHRKRDQSWVGGIAQSAYEKFEQKKQEISSQNTFVSGEDEVNSQPNMPPDMDIWVGTVGKKKMRVFGLGSLSKSLISSSNQSTSANTREVDDLRSQVHALNASLQRQAQEKEQMMQQLQRQDQEMKETNQRLSSLMQHLGFTGSSSYPPQANNEKFTNEDEDGNQKLTNEDEDDNNEFEEDDNNYFEDHYNYNEYEDLN